MINCVVYLFKVIFFIIFFDGDVLIYIKIFGILNIKIFIKSEGYFSIIIKEKIKIMLKIICCLLLGL